MFRFLSSDAVIEILRNCVNVLGAYGIFESSPERPTVGEELRECTIAEIDGFCPEACLPLGERGSEREKEKEREGENEVDSKDGRGEEEGKGELAVEQGTEEDGKGEEGRSPSDGAANVNEEE